MSLSEDLYAIRKQIHSHINGLPDDWWQWADELVDDLTKAIAKARELENYLPYIPGPWPTTQTVNVLTDRWPNAWTQRSETFPNDEDKKAYDVLSSSKILKSDWYEEDTLPPDILQDDSV